MTTEITIFLDALNSDFNSIKEQATKYFDNDSKIREDGAAQIFRRPWVAPLNFGLLLFPPVNKAWLSEFYNMTNKIIPPIYQDILLCMNGCFVYDFALYGLPKTIYTEGLLSRRILQQYDLGTANTTWIHNYEIDKNLFYIGGRAYSDDENIGYFIDENRILSIRKNGEVMNSWTTFPDFLVTEISISEQRMLQRKK